MKQRKSARTLYNKRKKEYFMRTKYFILITALLISTVINLQAQTPRTVVQETRVRTERNTTLINGFRAGSANYDIVNVDGRTNVIKINGAACDWFVLGYSLPNYRGKPITIQFSADVMRLGSGHIIWHLNNENYPTVTNIGNSAQGVWYSINTKYNITPTNRDPLFYLTTWESNFPDTFFYFDNISITIETWETTPATVLRSAGERGTGERNYYVSAIRGSDNGNGTQAQPFQKIAHAMYYVRPGDTVFVDSGTYHERFRIPSGSARSPVTLTAMPGADVIITPTVSITPKWRQHRGNIWVADVSEYVRHMNTEFPQLFADGDSMVEARFPNMGPSMSTIMDYKRDVAQRGTNKNTVVASRDIPANIAGARLVIWPGEEGFSWDTASAFVQSVNGRTIRLTQDISGSTPGHPNDDPYTPHPGNPFYITGALFLLDAPGEYYFDPNTNLLYFYPPWNGRPDTRALSLRGTSDIAIHAGDTSYVNIKNVKVYGGGIFMQNSNNSTIENCKVSYADHFYITGVNGMNDDPGVSKRSMIVSGSNNRIARSEFGPTAGSGIILEGENITFTNNIIHNSGYAGFHFFGITVLPSKRVEISHNSILNSAHTHIWFKYGNFERIVIRNNYFENHAILNSDAGAFYTHSTDGGGTEIYNNFVVCGNKNDQGTMHKIRIGLYTDNYTSNYTIRNNIIIGGSNGLGLNLWSRNVRFQNNTIVGADIGINMYGYSMDNADASTSSLTNNLFVNIRTRDITYYGTENGRFVEYLGNFVNGTVPAPVRQEGRVQSSGNVRGTVDAQYRPTGNTPDGVGAISRNGTMFSYGADWEL